ncbi:hypothetical protein GCM10007390_48030 [Persicitalea jodogahamensis]|uniref:Peptidase M14 domain-containing protein n=2 Tax=Persicitalea jodogahamensis TaxID=402147 RepID=A0A8J3GC65_9BACT|nr:hypothetical protein GCM10007390_48030 [Persicitalea jodogahamensis]
MLLLNTLSATQLAPAYGQSSSAGVSISANFEGGRLGQVTQVSNNRWQCALLGETDSENRNRQASWYYFRVDGSKDQPLTIELTDLVGEYNYRYGTIPVSAEIRPVISYDQTTWRHLTDDEVQWNDADTTLMLSFTPQHNTVWVAHLVPYTNQTLGQLLDTYQSRSEVELDTMGVTPEERPLLLLTVTNPEIPISQKKVVWLMARQHSWEAGTSYVMEGLIRYLLDSNKGRTLLDQMVFKLISISDPDGVARGGVRFNAFGHDLNRNWDYVITKEMPEIKAQKQAIKKWLAQDHPIDLFVTLHNTKADFVEGPDQPEGHKLWKEMAQSLSMASEKGLRVMKASTTAGKPGRMTVFQGLWSEFKIPAFLIEMNVGKVEKPNRHRTVEDWLAIGPKLAEAVKIATSD